MINELSSILISVLSTGALGTIVVAVVNHKHNKKMNVLQEMLEEANLSRAKIESKKEEWGIYKEQLESANEQIKVLNERNQQLLNSNIERYNQSQEREIAVCAERDAMILRHNDQLNASEERFNNQTNYLRSIQRMYREALEEINRLTLEKAKMQRIIDHLRQWFCMRCYKDCKRRKPEQEVKPTKYLPLPDNDSDLERLVKEYTKETKEAIDNAGVQQAEKEIEQTEVETVEKP